MSITSAVVRELIAAGLEGEALVAALERIEAASAPVRTARQERNRRYYESRREELQERARERKARLKPSETSETSETSLKPSETERENGVVPSSPVPPAPSPRTPNPHPLYPLSPSARDVAGDRDLFCDGKPAEANTAKPKSKPERKATRLPEDFTLTPLRFEFARKERLPDEQITREFERFRDHWLQASGRNAAKRDWDATWRNWVREAADRLSRSRSHAPGGSRSEGGNLLRAYQRAASRFA